MIQNLFQKNYYVKYHNFYWFNPKTNNPLSKQIFFLTGVIFGLAIINGISLNVQFPIALFRKIKKIPNEIKELENFVRL